MNARTAFVTVLAIVALATNSHAQTGAARLALQHGVELRYRGDDAGALVEFQRAYAASHSPLALAQMGLAEGALGQWVPAEAHLREALAIHADAWIEGHREALSSFYAETLRHIEPARPATATGFVSPIEPSHTEPPAAAPEASPPAAPLPESAAVETHSIRLWMSAGAVVGIGLGFVGVGIRESIVTTYNRDCRGFGDPSPAAGCDQTTNSNNANAASALATGGFVAGGVLVIVTAFLFTRPSSAPVRRFALRCGGGPGDIGISCGGSL